MNSQVQYLQKQIQRRDAQIQVLLMALDGCEREKDLSESVACAFAWDLQVSCSGDYYADPVAWQAEAAWVESLESARVAREEAGK